MARKNRELDAVMGQGPMLIEFYRNNPCIAAYDLLGVDLAPIQRVIFEDMWFRNYTITVAGRGFGKSFLLGTLSALSALLYPGYRVGLVGPSFRQSKMIFAEVEKLYDKSPILRAATMKRPIRGSDTAYLKFKSVGDKNSSFIEAIPIGNDGAKIRGSRFYLICVDELAQVGSQILDMVLRPMGATKQDPMANVRRIEQIRKLIEAGLATEEDLVDDQVNKMVMTSSGFYKFNHMYKRMRSYWSEMEREGDDKSAFKVHQVPYWMLPEGFLDMKNIEEARRVMSDHEFRMEYLAEMVSDSEGFFKASLLEACTVNSGHTIELKGVQSSEYILGIDPNQGGSASCGVVVVKLGTPSRIVNVLELKGKKTQDLVTDIQDLCDQYSVIRIYMDKGGGGKAVQDLLEEGYNNKTPIYDRNDETNLSKDGKHILEMVTFNPQWISEANFSTLALFESRRFLFPEPPKQEGSGDAFFAVLDKLESSYLLIDRLKKQCLNIVVTQTSSGQLHFDTPKKNQNKDLYSALILAGQGVKLLSKEEEAPKGPIIHMNGGVIRPHSSGASWSSIDSHNSIAIAPPMSQDMLGLAVLNPKIK